MDDGSCTCRTILPARNRANAAGGLTAVAVVSTVAQEHDYKCVYVGLVIHNWWIAIHSYHSVLACDVVGVHGPHSQQVRRLRYTHKRRRSSALVLYICLYLYLSANSSGGVVKDVGAIQGDSKVQKTCTRWKCQDRGLGRLGNPHRSIVVYHNQSHHQPEHIVVPPSSRYYPDSPGLLFRLIVCRSVYFSILNFMDQNFYFQRKSFMLIGWHLSWLLVLWCDN